MKEASFYTKNNGKVNCYLCPHNCAISESKSGICMVRKNMHGKLIAETYGKICSSRFDPVEKKPLYHFHPGKTIFSIGSIGCNLRCKFCQNWEISQPGSSEQVDMQVAGPDEIVKTAKKRKDNIGLAYTYNEPTVWYEYMFDIAKSAHQSGLKNVMVTNGFINQEPLEKIIPYMDAFSVDIKAFTEEFYKELTSSRLAPVLETIKLLKKHNKHTELTNLIITDTNDDPGDFTDMVNWIYNETGKDTVLHISRYFPMYKMTKEATSTETLRQFYHIAKEKLNYVYLGNIRSGEGQDTQCPKCKLKVISRTGYYTEIEGLSSKGQCLQCHYPLFNYIN